MKYTRYNDPPYSPICAGCREPEPDCFFFSPDCPRQKEDSYLDNEFISYCDDDCANCELYGECSLF